MSSKTKTRVRKQSRELNKAEVYEFCKQNGLNIRDMNEYQVRINERLDIYPTSMKCCLVKKGWWGVLGSLSEILELLGTKPESNGGLILRNKLIDNIHKRVDEFKNKGKTFAFEDTKKYFVNRQLLLEMKKYIEDVEKFFDAMHDSEYAGYPKIHKDITDLLNK